MEDVNESIHAASRIGLIEAVKQHLAAGVDVNAKGNIGETPLDWAIRGKHTEIADLLRKHGGKSGAEDSIQVAASVGNIQAVKQHLAAGTDVNAKEEDLLGWTPLHYAVSLVYLEVAELLIAKGADVNAKNDGGETPLDKAKNKPKITDLLRKHGGKTGEELKAEGK